MRYSALKINGRQLTPGSDFRISWSLAPIAGASNMRRDVNGELVNLNEEDSGFRKYRVSISGEGRRVPAIADLMPGDPVTIEWPEPIFISGMDFGRQIIERIGVRESGGQYRALADEDFPGPVVEIGVRPIFECLVIQAPISGDEHKKNASWTLEAEEI